MLETDKETVNGVRTVNLLYLVEQGKILPNVLGDHSKCQIFYFNFFIRKQQSKRK